MDQTQLLASLDANMAVLQTVINSSVGLFLIGGWTALQRERKISFSNISLSPNQAHFLFSFGFLLINMTTVIIIGKLYFIFSLVDSIHTIKAITIVATHSWAFNPFFYAGESLVRNLFSACGIFILIIIWWTCPSCIVLFRGVKQRPYHRAYFFLYMLSGITILFEIYILASLISERSILMGINDIQYADSVSFKVFVGCIAVIIGLALYVTVRMRFHAEAVDGMYEIPAKPTAGTEKM